MSRSMSSSRTIFRSEQSRIGLASAAILGKASLQGDAIQVKVHDGCRCGAKHLGCHLPEPCLQRVELCLALSDRRRRRLPLGNGTRTRGV